MVDSFSQKFYVKRVLQPKQYCFVQFTKLNFETGIDTMSTSTKTHLYQFRMTKWNST